MFVGIVQSAVTCALGASAGAAAHAQLPAPTLAQLAHRAWTMRDGAPGAVNALAQTPDGSLWLGTGMGLYRFDGVRFEAFEPPAGQALPSRVINALFAFPDGALWIGYTTGGASVLAADRLVNYGESDGLPGGTVTAVARDPAGTIWAATTSGLARLAGGRWHRVGPESGFPGGATADLLVDRRGTLWAAELTGVYVLPPGTRRFVRRAPSLTVGEKDAGRGAIREAPDGSVWGASVPSGLVQLSDSSGDPPPANAHGYLDPGWTGMFVDRQGNAWRLGDTDRIVRIPLSAAHGGKVVMAAAVVRETLSVSPATRMSGHVITTGLEDREGTVWVGTEGGIDQFRPTKLTPVVWPRSVVAPVIVANDGDGVWVGSSSGPLVAVADRITERPEVPTGITCASRDPDGGVWLGGETGLWRGRGGRFAAVALPREATGLLVQAVARDRNGTLWVSVLYRGAFRQRGGVWERFVAQQELGNANPQTILADRAGRTWLGYKQDRLALVASDSVHVYTAADGLRVGTVTAIHVRGAHVWVGGDFGVMALELPARDGARFTPVTVAGGAFHSVSGIVESANGDLWLNSDEGVTRISISELRRARGDPAYRARDERFGLGDGLYGAAVHIRPLGTAIEGTDGRLWFTTQTGVASLDPEHIRRNALPPPVRIGALDAGGRRYAGAGGVSLPPRTTAFSVAYTALSLAVPERVRFRYRLTGGGAADTAWQDAGGRREAFYTNLGPGSYRFQVIAANEDGVWNAVGAALDVVIPPTFVQTRVFLALCAAAAAGATWVLVQWRHRRVAHALRAQYRATLDERLRVARELHDTLLSDLAGITMRLDAATRSATRVNGDAALLADLRDQARRTLGDTRRAVGEMRTASADLVPLWVQVADAARRIFADTSIDARVEHVGRPRGFPPAVEAEALRIATEAMVNARKHADCHTVAVTCRYTRRELRVHVRDDGRGFDPAVAGANGHYGLAGMRERTTAIGAQLTVDSAPGRGTDVRLVVRDPSGTR